jgi:hypothetical protein
MKILEKHRRVKTKFWAAIANNPLIDVLSLPTNQVVQKSGTAELATWLRDDEFREWFFNKNVTREALEEASEVAVATLLAICSDTDVGPKGRVTAAAQVNAAKTILEMAGYAPPKQRIIEYKDKEIGDMSEADLRDYLGKHTPQLVRGVDSE